MDNPKPPAEYNRDDGRPRIGIRAFLDGDRECERWVSVEYARRLCADLNTAIAEADESGDK